MGWRPFDPPLVASLKRVAKGGTHLVVYTEADLRVHSLYFCKDMDNLLQYKGVDVEVENDKRVEMIKQPKY